MNYTHVQYASALNAALTNAKTKDMRTIVLPFLELLARHKATARLPYIMRAFTKIERMTHGITDLSIESAAELSKETKHELTHTPDRKTRIRITVRPELLAGLMIIVNDELLIDATGRRQLEQLMTASTLRTK